jgi:uncharacterized protein
MIFLAFSGYLPGGPRIAYPVRTLATAAALVLFSRAHLRVQPSRAWGSILVGVAVCAVWIGPDILWPGYRGHWLLSNPLTGTASGALGLAARTDWLLVSFRVAGSTLVVPFAEELFWRGYLMRWLVRKDFESVALGLYTATSFWLTALLFASEHGAYWDVGLVAGAIYGWWLVRTRNLSDCILAHAVTNGLLAGYVVGAGKWQFWL